MINMTSQILWILKTKMSMFLFWITHRNLKGMELNYSNINVTFAEKGSTIKLNSVIIIMFILEKNRLSANFVVLVLLAEEHMLCIKEVI